jgi:hypothetical protein
MSFLVCHSNQGTVGGLGVNTSGIVGGVAPRGPLGVETGCLFRYSTMVELRAPVPSPTVRQIGRPLNWDFAQRCHFIGDIGGWINLWHIGVSPQHDFAR